MLNDDDHHADYPRAEPWLKIMALAFVPLLLSLFIPAPIKFILMGLAGATLIAGLVLMVRTRPPNRRGD